MPVQLEIEDGSPWYLSTDIWTVPGSDPEGAVGMPLAGAPCYLWARVQNNGSSRVENASVKYYWANPSVGFDRTTANVVGVANVTLDPSTEADVLCLAAWIPEYVNGGHECVLAEAYHPSQDPLPASPAFNVPTDRHVAQRNLSVLPVMARFHLAFEIHNPSRKPGSFQIQAKKAEPESFKGQAVRMPFLQEFLRRDPGVVEGLGFAAAACPNETTKVLEPETLLQLRERQRLGLSVVGNLQGDVAYLHVEHAPQSREMQLPLGGLSILLVNEKLYREVMNRKRGG